MARLAFQQMNPQDFASVTFYTNKPSLFEMPKSTVFIMSREPIRGHKFLWQAYSLRWLQPATQEENGIEGMRFPWKLEHLQEGHSGKRRHHTRLGSVRLWVT